MRFNAHRRVEVAAPRPDEIGYIRDTYFQLAAAGRSAEQHHAGLTKLAHALPGGTNLLTEARVTPAAAPS